MKPTTRTVLAEHPTRFSATLLAATLLVALADLVALATNAVAQDSADGGRSGRRSALRWLRPAASEDDDALPPAKSSFTEEQFARHIAALKKRLPSDGYTILVEPPFVVIGDGPEGEVRRFAVGTVRWAVHRLKKEYFAKDPAEILDIFLFQDAESYKKHCETLFQSKSESPYGFFSSADKALVMNIATGGGTLVHEIVHPFVAANFPRCPTWLNEGLGSLYEQCEDRRGRIHGRTNWRLEGLQKAIREKKLVPFEKLCGMDSEKFYDAASGAHYAQARYLCYYLQEQGLLKKFYHDLVANQRRDPTGYKTLQAVLERDDMTAFQKEWEEYVMRLRFP